MFVGRGMGVGCREAFTFPSVPLCVVASLIRFTSHFLFLSLKTQGSCGQGVYQLFLVFVWRLLYLKINLDTNKVNTKD